jgi:hypothetical protein
MPDIIRQLRLFTLLIFVGVPVVIGWRYRLRNTAVDLHAVGSPEKWTKKE